MEQNVEVKETQPKKKRNWLFTLFACIATGIIVFLAMNIGEDLGKTVDPKTDSSNNKKVTCEEKECDCKEENTTTETNSNSNTTTTSNSNTTQQQPQTQPTTTTYTMDKVKGTYELKTDIYTRTIVLSDKGLFTLTHATHDAGVGVFLGNYTVENNTIKLNYMVQQHAGPASSINKFETVTITSADTIVIDGNTLKRTSNDYSNADKMWRNFINDYTDTTSAE